MVDQVVKCCDANGGRIQIKIDGVPYATRGGIRLKFLNFNRTAEANDDGSIAIKTVPKEITCDVTFAFNCALSLDVFKDCRVDLTIKFIDMNETFLMTNATITGDPEINSADGTITGAIFAADNLQQIQ